MKSCAAGLRARFFTVATPTRPANGSSMGSSLMPEGLVGNRNTDRGRIARAILTSRASAWPLFVICASSEPPNRGLISAHFHGAHAPVEEPSTASTADVTALIGQKRLNLADERLPRGFAWKWNVVI